MSDVSAEQPADWDALWEREQASEDVAGEAAGLRWSLQEHLVTQRFGGFENLEVIEIGAGRAANALRYAQHGARVTVLDQSTVALEQARAHAARAGVAIEAVCADVFALPDALLGRFGVAMSFGLCEHFLGARRLGVVGAHLRLVAPGGLAIINVPHRYSPIYRAWMGFHKRRGSWVLGTEEPFSPGELAELGRLSGGIPLRPRFGGGVGTLVGQGLNPVLARLGRRPVPPPQWAIPGIDRLSYDLMVPMVRPA